MVRTLWLSASDKTMTKKWCCNVKFSACLKLDAHWTRSAVLSLDQFSCQVQHDMPYGAVGVRTLIENNVFEFERCGMTRLCAALLVRCLTALRNAVSFHPPCQKRLCYGLLKVDDIRKQWLRFICSSVPEDYNPNLL